MSAPKKVLIIDDDADYRQLMGEVLQMEGWQVLTAGDGEEGLEVARQKRPDVVLCDLLMPRSNGFLVCTQIRGDYTLRHTKLVVTSGRDYDSDRLAAREAGADEYLTKPIKPYDVLALISRLCDDVQGGAPLPTVSDPTSHQPALLRSRFGRMGKSSFSMAARGCVRWGANWSTSSRIST
jgi:DNA-binding response OmpR family regulator